MIFQNLRIRSGNGEYQVEFVDNAIQRILIGHSSDELLFLIDEKIWTLYPSIRRLILDSRTRYTLIRATEESKSYENIGILMDELLMSSFKRGQKLVAVGGGITQDIVGFIASIVFRGVPWLFVPTSLLSQADSCIGSKTSVNLGRRKNALGTFHHPDSIYIDLKFLETLTDLEIKSGIGEMIKVHIINSMQSFDLISQNYELLTYDKQIMREAIFNSLKFKKEIIERDEKDTNIRLVMNYGHTFGHAIEVATGFDIPHGLAVTLGMDTANYISSLLNPHASQYYEKFHPVLLKNLKGLGKVSFSREDYLSALINDKKNTSKERNYILLDSNGSPKMVSTALDSTVPLDSCKYIESFLQSC